VFAPWDIPPTIAESLPLRGQKRTAVMVALAPKSSPAQLPWRSAIEIGGDIVVEGVGVGAGAGASGAQNCPGGQTDVRAGAVKFQFGNIPPPIGGET